MATLKKIIRDKRIIAISLCTMIVLMIIGIGIKSKASGLDEMTYDVGNDTKVILKRSSWKSGSDSYYLYNVEIKNNGSNAIDGWKLSIDLKKQASVVNDWCTTIKSSGTTINAEPLFYNKKIEKNSSVSYGFIVKSEEHDISSVLVAFNGSEGSEEKTDVTQAPATQAPATKAPATQAPATQVPATQVPATQTPATQTPATQAPSSNMKSAKEIVASIKIGWNLGNTLDSTCDWISNPTVTQFETAWGNPVTTKAMITGIKKAGFNAIRIPVSWGQKMSSDYTVDEAWMNRVNEVVDYAIDNDMYVILNTHHDIDWLYPDNSHKDSASKQLEKLWIQIATRFNKYDSHLIFETMNEPRLKDTSYEWTAGTKEAWDVINVYNKVAVDAIRNTGGNNKTRAIMIPTYAANSTDEAMAALTIPNNDSNIIMSIHAYSPYQFAMVVGGTAEWGSSSDKQEMDNLMSKIAAAAAKKGVPVIIGEFGTINKSNTSARAAHAAYFKQAAAKQGIACFWWDNGVETAGEGESYSIFNRNNCTVSNQDIVNALVK
ncbi:MAG: cellulase family glycosylhydrolase [Lachnospiraceae bacterium]|nr:cellulase family glycosylhydrolase [Lachnospiraceae bacterium]